jgi:hypothetical protein
MVQARYDMVFPKGTLFFQMDGVLFASLPDEHWCAVDDNGCLVALSDSYAAEISRMIDHGEIIDEATFRRALAPDAVLPEPEEADPAGVPIVPAHTSGPRVEPV